MTAAEAYNKLTERLRAQADIVSTLRLLEWDQDTYLPAGAAESRASQMGTLAGILHEHQTAPDFLGLVDDLASRVDDLDEAQAVDVRETKWQLDRERALDTDLVRERSQQRAIAKAAWAQAREDADFNLFAPHLAANIAFEKRVAAAIDPHRDPYEVLLETYEPGMKLTTLESALGDIRAALQPLIERLRTLLDRSSYPPSPLRGEFAPDAQRAFNRLAVEQLGFDMSNGRIDESAHPFSTTIGSDVRLTTRYDERDLTYSLYSTLHEAGHGLYEQGLRRDRRGLPTGSACSLGVHESQSRLWENQIGRSRAYWERMLPEAAKHFPALRNVSVDDVTLAANRAEPSLIRTESDEITYNLHILLRFELERELIGGNLDTTDAPSAWRTKMNELLGVAPTTDREGVLQDVHWSGGDFGYFPTYTLGNLYAAQLLEAAGKQLGNLDDLVRHGELGVLLGWLRENVHRHGKTYRSTELIERATGAKPSGAALGRYLERKLTYLEEALGNGTHRMLT